MIFVQKLSSGHIDTQTHTDSLVVLNDDIRPKTDLNFNTKSPTLIRGWNIAGLAAPDTPCTMDSSSLGVGRRLGHDATNTTHQGR